MRKIWLVLAGTTVAMPTFAADLGAYRPGEVYHAVTVPTANVCESQCAGDAKCRSWNYVKPSQSADGVCEFQSRSGHPVSSNISISGISMTAAPLSDRLISGATNTIRVGAQPTPKPAPQVERQGTRTIVREQAPQIYQPHQTSRSAQPLFRPMLDSHDPSAIAPQGNGYARGPARRAPNQRQVLPQTQPANAPQILMQSRPPVGQAIAPPSAPTIQSQTAPMPRASANNPVRDMPKPAPLYGTLYDDIQPVAGNAMPRPVGPVSQMPLPAPRG